MNVSNRASPNQWLIIAGFVLVNLLVKGAFLNINQGEYTDGILQLTVFQNHAGLYPPLYGALAWLVAFTGVPLETAGRLISLFAAALCVIPVLRLARRLGGSSAAIYASVLYTLSPMPWRWSIRVMTDSLYLLLSTVTLVLLMEAWVAIRQPGDETATQSRSKRLLAIATICGALAVFTRYQGILFVPLIAIVMFAFFRRLRRLPFLAIGASTVWLVLPVWMATNGFVHQQQFTTRTGLTALATVSAWWNTLESFVLISPYYIGYPIAAASIVGVFAVRRTAALYTPRPAARLWGAHAVMLLGLQAAFGSFQYRYMMPLLPIVVALGGIGFSQLEIRLPRQRWVFSLILLVSLADLLIFSLGILIFQREAFADQREAARFIQAKVPATTPVFSNERYGNFTQLGSVKISYWAGRKVTPLLSPDATLPAGSILVLGTAYGGDEAVAALMQQLSTRYQLRPLLPQPMRSQLLPIMDDIMVNPLYNQNPLAWVLRYVPQNFATQIFELQPLTESQTDAR